MVAGVFETLPQTQRVTYISTLVRSLHDLPTVRPSLFSLDVGIDRATQDDVFASKAALAKLDLTTENLIAVIQSILEPLEAAPQRKKQKQEEK
jgi:hypothetical protein